MRISSWARRTGWLSLACVLLGVGCFSTTRGYPLYPGPTADPSAVAKLTGHVRTVDGKNISRLAHDFELLPGCHVITTPQSWGGVGERGGVVANTAGIVYSIDMRAGHSYVIEVKPAGSAGSIQSVRITAKEKDATGKVTDTFSPANDPTCQEDHRGGKDIVVSVPTLGS